MFMPSTIPPSLLTILLFAIVLTGCEADLAQDSVDEQGAVTIEFYIASDSASPGLEVHQVRGEDRSLYLSDMPFLTLSDIERGEVAESDYGDGLRLILSDEGREELMQATSANVGRPMAIAIDGVVVSAPQVRAPIDSRELLVTGSLERSEIDRIVASVNADPS